MFILVEAQGVLIRLSMLSCAASLRNLLSTLNSPLNPPNKLGWIESIQYNFNKPFEISIHLLPQL